MTDYWMEQMSSLALEPCGPFFKDPIFRLSFSSNYAIPKIKLIEKYNDFGHVTRQ